MPPAMLGAVNQPSQARAPLSSPRYAHMLPNDPGHKATVLVAFAEIGGTPSQTIAGNVISVPPPAIELTAPPMSAARKTSRNPPAVTRQSRLGSDLDFLPPPILPSLKIEI